MARDVSDTTPITSRNMLVEWLEAGSKTAGAPLRIGTEHEKIPFYAADDSPVPYEGSGGRGGVRALLEGLRDTLGWAPILDQDARGEFRVRVRFDRASVDTPEAEAALRELSAAFDRHRIEFLVEKNQAYIIDNRRIVHGRTPFSPTFSESDRHLKRILGMR